MPQSAKKGRERCVAASKAVNAFSAELYHRVSSSDGNVLISPYSIHEVLTIAWAGAAARTAQQMAQVLHWGLQSREDASSQDAIVTDWGEGAADHVSVASSIWTQKGYVTSHQYKTRQNHALREVDFACGHDRVRDQINAWVSEATARRINEIVPPGGVDSLTRFVLANAIYFRADWREKFDPADTHEAPFYLADGRRIGVAMMRQTGNFRVAQNDQFTVINLLYEGFHLAMQVFIPRQTASLPQLEQTLFQSPPAEWGRGMEWKRVTLSLPRFRFDSSLLLGTILSSMGMSDAFDRTAADFTEMTSNADFALSEVIHKTYIAVDEEGTEAAGATAAVLTGGCGGEYEPLTLTVDRPFLFTICSDSRIGTTILFIGRMMQP